MQFYRLDSRGLDDLGMRNSLAKHAGVRSIVRNSSFGKLDKPVLEIGGIVAAQYLPQAYIVSRNR